MLNNYPKITVVTPSYNQHNYLEETILSVIGQRYPNLEYIIIDGQSTDGSVEIIKKYESYLSHWVSEPDSGMYDALQKGFSKSSGDIMTWINSDDTLARNSLFTAAEVFNDFQSVDWLTGIPNHMDESGRIVKTGYGQKWNKYRYLQLDYQHIQQEGTFWRRSLWTNSGGHISTKFNLAGDLELWSRFFQHASLYCITGLLGTFRLRSNNQKSVEGVGAYHDEAMHILKHMPRSAEEDVILSFRQSWRWFLLKRKGMRRFQKLSAFEKVENTLNNFPPILVFDRVKQRYTITTDQAG